LKSGEAHGSLRDYRAVGIAALQACKEAEMRKERLTHFRKKLEEKHRQLVDEVGRNVLYGKGPEDDSIKDLGDQASSAYNREFQFELGNGDRRLLKEVTSALQKLDDGNFGACERCGETIAEKRLEALPFARYCIDCQRAVEEEERTAAG
jgi:DnaK suppressor protein